jgi:hypothetical protein
LFLSCQNNLIYLITKGKEVFFDGNSRCLRRVEFFGEKC